LRTYSLGYLGRVAQQHGADALLREVHHDARVAALEYDELPVFAAVQPFDDHNAVSGGYNRADTRGFGHVHILADAGARFFAKRFCIKVQLYRAVLKVGDVARRLCGMMNKSLDILQVGTYAAVVYFSAQRYHKAAQQCGIHLGFKTDFFADLLFELLADRGYGFLVQRFGGFQLAFHSHVIPPSQRIRQ
jgi:hypothetical protein